MMLRGQPMLSWFTTKHFSGRTRLVAMLATVGVVSVSGAEIAAAGPADAASGRMRLIVQTKPGLSVAAQHGAVARDGGQLLTDVSALRSHVVEVPAGEAAAILKRYQSDSTVSHAELDAARHVSGAG